MKHAALDSKKEVRGKRGLNRGEVEATGQRIRRCFGLSQEPGKRGWENTHTVHPKDGKRTCWCGSS